MSYRDDHDALHERAEELERDLGRARQQLEENRLDRGKVQRLEKELAKARAKIERLQRSPEGQKSDEVVAARRRLFAILGAAVGILVMAVVGVLTFRATAVREKESGAQENRAALDREAARVKQEAARLKEEQERTARLAEEAAAQRARANASTPARLRKPARSVTARWRATVKEVRGRPVRPGARCTLVVQLTITESTASAGGLEIRCGAHVLRDPRDAMGSGSSLSDASATPSGDGGRYRLKYSDQGARTGPRAQVSVDTAARVAEAWSDNAPRWRAVLKVDELSAPIEPAPAEQ